jgi:flagellar protein FliS
MVTQGYKQYQRTQTETASPAELVVMMYNGALKFLAVARQKMEAGELEEAHNSQVRGPEIILELMISVDVGVAPVARNLFDLYEFMHRHLVQANVSKDPKMVGDVVDLLRELLGSWEQAIASERQAKLTQTKVVAVA